MARRAYWQTKHKPPGCPPPDDPPPHDCKPPHNPPPQDCKPPNDPPPQDCKPPNNPPPQDCKPPDDPPPQDDPPTDPPPQDCKPPDDPPPQDCKPPDDPPPQDDPPTDPPPNDCMPDDQDDKECPPMKHDKTCSNDDSSNHEQSGGFNLLNNNLNGSFNHILNGNDVLSGNSVLNGNAISVGDILSPSVTTGDISPEVNLGPSVSIGDDALDVNVIDAVDAIQGVAISDLLNDATASVADVDATDLVNVGNIKDVANIDAIDQLSTLVTGVDVVSDTLDVGVGDNLVAALADIDGVTNSDLGIANVGKVQDVADIISDNALHAVNTGDVVSNVAQLASTANVNGFSQSLTKVDLSNVGAAIDTIGATVDAFDVANVDALVTEPNLFDIDVPSLDFGHDA